MKVKQKLISLILSLTLVMGLATAPAFASSDPDTSYFINSVARNWTGASGVHSISNGTKLGNLVAAGIQYLSLDLDAIDSSLYQIYTSLSSLSGVNTNTNNILTILNSLTSGWYSADSSLNPPQGQNNSWYYRVLQALGEIKTINDNEYSGLAGHLGAISSKLDAWTGTDTLDIADIVYDIYKNNENNIDFFEDALSGGAITSDWHWNDNGTWRAVGSGAIPVINRNSDGQLYLNVYPYESSDLSIKGFIQAMIRNQFYETTAIRGTYENNNFVDYTSSGAISGEIVDNVIRSLSHINNNLVTSSVDNVTLLNQINDDYNNINWVNYNNSYLGTKSVVNGDYLSSSVTGLDFYSFYYFPYGYNIYNLKVPVGTNNLQTIGGASLDIEFMHPSSFTVYDGIDIIDYHIDYSGCNILVRVKQQYTNNIPVCVHISRNDGFNGSLRFNPSRPHSLSYLDYNSKDFYDVGSYLNTSFIEELFEQAKFMFFDDESIQAKKNNASQTSTVIDNFTGSGDASADVSDFAGVKDSVSALKSSLSGGASYTQAFNILGSDSDGWSWFSQEVADSMDSTNSTRGLLRGNISSSTPYLDSYYDSIYSVIGIGGDVE